MASVGHLMFGAMLGRVYQHDSRRSRLQAGAALACLGLLPDCDVINVALGAPDSGLIGHRGFSHTWVFAVLIAAAAWLWARRAKIPPIATGLLVFAAVASHGILDALTGDSRGIFLFWPVVVERLAFPWRPLPNPPTGMAFFSVEGLTAGAIEILCFTPMILAWVMWPAGGTRGDVHRRALVAVGVTTGLLAVCVVLAIALRAALDGAWAF